MKIWLPLLLIFTLGAAPNPQVTQDELNKTPVPLRLQIQGDGSIRLYNEPLGSVADLRKLKNKLQSIVSARKKNQVFDPGLHVYTSKGINYPTPLRVIVEPDRDLKFAEVLEVLYLVRYSGASQLDLQITVGATKFSVTIPVPIDRDCDIAKLKPNPLTLVIGMDKNQQLTLNSDPQDSLAALIDRLKGIFQNRKEMRAYRPVPEGVYTTVFVRADSSLSFSKVIDLLNAVHSTGANPLGLQIDGLLGSRQADKLPSKAKQLFIRRNRTTHSTRRLDSISFIVDLFFPR